MKLSPGHRSPVTVRLSALERSLDEVEALIRRRPEDGLLHRWFDSLTEDEKRHLEQLISQARCELRALVEEFALPAETADIRGRIQTILAMAWSDLEDTRPRKLRGYGEMPADAADFLDLHVLRLIHLITAMSAIAGGEGEGNEESE